MEPPVFYNIIELKKSKKQKKSMSKTDHLVCWKIQLIHTYNIYLHIFFISIYNNSTLLWSTLYMGDYDIIIMNLIYCNF